jgi:hydrogenase nickel incorporation protein HypA/HybF
MHELAIATDIITIVESSARNSGASIVEAIELEIGELSGIETEALRMALEISVKNTLMDGAEIRLLQIKGEAHCLDCGRDSEMHDLFSVCPYCSSFRRDITKGKEMKIKSIVVCKAQ